SWVKTWVILLFVLISAINHIFTYKTGGEKGIRTLDTGLSPYNALAGRRLRPLGHLSAYFTSSWDSTVLPASPDADWSPAAPSAPKFTKRPRGVGDHSAISPLISLPAGI